MFDDLWLVPRGKKKLVLPYEARPDASPIRAAQAFTVSFVSLVVNEDLEGLFSGNNDLLAMSRTSLGDRPLVRRVHAFEQEVPEGQPMRNVLADNVFVEDDYSATERLWLQMEVIETDTHRRQERQAVIQSFQSLAASAGAIFPAVLPYSFGVSAVAGIFGKILDAIERDTTVIEVPISLFPDPPRPGRAQLQAGSYVAFGRPISDPDKYLLQPNGLLTGPKNEVLPSYLVFDIAPVERVAPKLLITQKIATLLTQIDEGNRFSTRDTIEFLSETLTAYDHFRKLERYLDLRGREQLSEEEEEQMRRIEEIDELGPFLPEEEEE